MDMYSKQQLQGMGAAGVGVIRTPDGRTVSVLDYAKQYYPDIAPAVAASYKANEGVTGGTLAEQENYSKNNLQPRTLDSGPSSGQQQPQLGSVAPKLQPRTMSFDSSGSQGFTGTLAPAGGGGIQPSDSNQAFSQNRLQPQQWSSDQGLAGAPGGGYAGGGTDPWAQIAGAYGLGAAPAEGLPMTLPGVQVGAPPQMNWDRQGFSNFSNEVGQQIGGAYGYDTPQGQASLINRGDVPNVNAQQYGGSDELTRLLSGEGYSPQTLAQMRATATEQPAQAGLQQMSHMKRILGQNGIQGGAAAALQGEVARQTGQNQGQALRDVDVRNANVGLENTRFGVGQQTGIGMGNMQSVNQMALANANMMFQALSQNQQAQNQMTQMNTGIKSQQQLSGANAQAGFFGQQGAQGQDQRYNTNQQNNQNQWQAQQQQTQYDWEKQLRPWQELNNRYSQSQNVLGGWASPQ